MGAVQKQIDDCSFQDRFDGNGFAGSGRAGEGENSAANYRADAKGRETPRPQRLAKTLVRILGRRDQLVNALRAEELAQCDGPPGLSIRRKRRRSSRRLFTVRAILAFSLALRLVSDSLLHRSAGNARGAFGLWRCLFAHCALGLFPFCLVCDVLRIH